ncbi:MAG: glycoside hydrolase family 3 protein, partial [Promicromonosporaceae bacterium]|nr:glycoside hydrolase family 3 protein [Promicromonosporaceae bacterium]
MKPSKLSKQGPKATASIVAAAFLLSTLVACTSEAEVSPEPEATTVAASTPDTDSGSGLTSYEIFEATDGRTSFMVIENPGDGPRLTFGADTGVSYVTVEEDGYLLAFRDINGNGVLDIFEDWRESPQTRAAALAQELSIEQIVGLMLFSPHQRDPEEGLTEVQETFLTEAHLRNVLNAGPANVEAVVRWVNEMQAFVEAAASDETPLIPVNFATDPRSTAGAATYNAAGGNSRWPSNLGLAATFDIQWMETFARTVTTEYRAMGMTTALSPMIELATEPRWLRVEGTLGEDLEWAAQLAAAYIAGYQGSYGTTAWGTESVNAMIKHFAGDGANEGGRGAHTVSGMYEVFPGGGFYNRLEVFTRNLNAAAVMTGYAVAIGADGNPLFDPPRGVAFDPGRMGILRNDYGFDGVVVTDWGVTRPQDHERPGRAWYMEGMSEGEVMFEGILVGLDMFGGNSDAVPVMEAFDIWQAKYEAGELPIDADTRWRETGRRVLTLKFQVGLYESPYLILEESLSIVGSPDKMDMGFEAQLNAVVMARNVDGTISQSSREDWANLTAYVPHTYMLGQPNAETRDIPIAAGPSLTVDILEHYFGNVVTDEVELDDEGRVLSATAPDLSDVDIVLVGMHSPRNGN